MYGIKTIDFTDQSLTIFPRYFIKFAYSLLSRESPKQYLSFICWIYSDTKKQKKYPD